MLKNWQRYAVYWLQKPDYSSGFSDKGTVSGRINSAINILKKHKYNILIY